MKTPQQTQQTKKQKTKKMAATHKFVLSSENLEFVVKQYEDEQLCDNEPVEPVIEDGVYTF